MELHIVAYETKNIVHGAICFFEEYDRHCRVQQCLSYVSNADCAV